MAPTTHEETARCKSCGEEFMYAHGKGRPLVYCGREGQCDRNTRKRKRQSGEVVSSGDTIVVHKPESSKAAQKRRAHDTGRSSSTLPPLAGQYKHARSRDSLWMEENQKVNEQEDYDLALAFKLQDEEDELARAEAKSRDGQGRIYQEWPLAHPADRSGGRTKASNNTDVPNTVDTPSIVENTVPNGLQQDVAVFDPAAAAADRISTKDVAHMTRWGIEELHKRAEQADGLKRRFVEQQAELDGLREQDEQKRTVIDELTSANQQLSKLQVEERGKVKRMETVTVTKEKQLKEALERLNEKEEKLREAACTSGELADLRVRMSVAVSEKTQLTMEKATIRGEKTNLEEELGSYKRDFHSEVSKLQHELARSQGKVRELQQSGHTSTVERDQFKEMLQAEEKMRRQVEAESANLLEQRDLAQRDKKELSAKTTALEAEVRTTKSLAEKLDIAQQEKRALQGQIELLGKQEQHAAKQLAEYQKSSCEVISKLQADVKSVTEELSGQISACESAVEENKRLGHEVATLTETLHQKSELYQQEGRELRESMEIARQSHVQQCNVLNVRIRSLQAMHQKDKAAYACELKKLAKGASVKEDNAYAALAARHCEMIYAQYCLDTQHEAECEYILANMQSSSQSALSASHSGAALLEQELQSCNTALERWASRYENCNKELQSVRREVDALGASVQNLEEKNKDIGADNKQLRLDVSEAKQGQNKFRLKSVSLEDQLKMHKKQLDTLKNDLANAQEKSKELNGEYCRWKSRCLKNERERDETRQRDSTLEKLHVTIETAERVLDPEYGVTLEHMYHLVQDPSVIVQVSGCVLSRHVEDITAPRKRYAPTKPIADKIGPILYEAYNYIRDPLFELSIDGHILHRGFVKLPQDEPFDIDNAQGEGVTNGSIMQPAVLQPNDCSKPWQLVRIMPSAQAAELSNNMRNGNHALHSQRESGGAQIHQGASERSDVGDGESNAAKDAFPKTNKLGLEHLSTVVQHKAARTSLPTPAPSVGHSSPQDSGLATPRSEAEDGEIATLPGSKRQRGSEADPRLDAPKQPRRFDPLHEEERNRYWRSWHGAIGRESERHNHERGTSDPRRRFQADVYRPRESGHGSRRC